MSENQSSSSLQPYKPLLAPIDLLVRPLRKRFRFHFYGKKQTNSIEKPEWYFTQVSNWIRDHSQYLQYTIQPILNQNNFENVDARIEFIRGLVVVLVEKVTSDIPLLLSDDYCFSHIIDELLLFENELHNKYYYPIELPSCIAALEDDSVIDKWISLEWKNGKEKINEIISSATAWRPKYKDVAQDCDTSLKFPEATENILTMLILMKERYSKLSSTSYMMQFVRMQLSLLDELYARFVELTKNGPKQLLDQDYSYILNGVNHLIGVLKKWSDQWFFLDLYAKEVKLRKGDVKSLEDDSNESEVLKENNDAVEGTIFDGIIGLYNILLDEMLNKLGLVVMQIIKKNAKPYCKQKWLSMQSIRGSTLQLSPSACDMLVSVRESLQYYQTFLDSSIFLKFWQRLAQEINEHLYQELVVSNLFNENGAKQLEYDVNKNLFILFREYTHRPDNFFKELKEACVLLNLNSGSVMLLQEILQSATMDLDDNDISASKARASAVAALNEIGIHRMELLTALQIIQLRIDWPKL
ncbi:uncharacterized protein TRIADDRAFT_31481 [Trichoplax adhaerens]|uniref:RAD50-interacting protein 1 n=1 Tax=Trichoplax adhaerens TaxID=10228 RepID=B3S9F4_TRIAD|nr:hypothetical protein TRIADDRAFT_31481 [Trichoplax adhaerens]EDV20641.1 hypothetical protein TRIADDRAFT_31481 [Trichoplax adhaerens]|eukprot:XP_002116841.1 hypothetical protein TRIADDRAFT_31481 [Trichoplax adhaerens]